MNRPDLPRTDTDTDHDADEALRRALRGLPAPHAASAELDALTAKVMAQWQQRHAGQAGGVVTQGHTATLGAQRWRRRLWIGSAGFVAAAALATAVLVGRPDPALEELMQPDVLSQMAIGEM